MGLEEFQGLYFIVMEYIDGETLADKLADSSDGKLDEDVVLEYMNQICLGLNEAHKNGVIHLDLKPQNIMVKENGEIKILDFSISHQITKSMTMLTGQNLSTGTLPYMAPEQLSKKFGRINEQADVWGLGAVMYHLISGEVPFEDRNQILDPEEEPYELEGVSDKISMIISGCLTKDRKERITSITEIFSSMEVSKAKISDNVDSKKKVLERIEEENKPKPKSKKGDLAITVTEDCEIKINNTSYRTKNNYLFVSDFEYGNYPISAETESHFASMNIKIEEKLNKINIELKQKMADLYAKSKLNAFKLTINGDTFICPELIKNIPVGEYEIEIEYNGEFYTDTIMLKNNETFEYEFFKDKLPYENVEELNDEISNNDSLLFSHPYNDFSEEQLKKIIIKNGFYDCNINKNRTFHNNFESKILSNDSVVIDNVTELMWHQYGSVNYMELSAAVNWIDSLNKKGYAGFRDWRLPTVSEGASLIQSKKSYRIMGIYMDKMFSKFQEWIWTGDRSEPNHFWCIDFNSGSVYLNYVAFDNINLNMNGFVKPVRNIKNS